MVSIDHKNRAGYAMAQMGAVYFAQQEAGYLRISGPDRTAFLQRQTTNDMGLLVPGQALLTVLTSATARILDVFYLLQEAETIGVITLPGQAEKTARFLKSRIFFMDKVNIEDASAEFAQFDLIGPQAAEFLHQSGIGQQLNKDGIASVEIGQAGARVLVINPSFGLGYRLIAPSSAGNLVAAKLSGHGVLPLEAESYELLRIEAGIPGASRELTEEYTPLETGLESVVADGKGCYTGQEILARQITYDKVTQRLAGLRIENPAKPGDRVWVEGKMVGSVSSAADSPRFGPIALAILKRPYYDAETAVKVGADPESGSSAVVSPLPFRVL